MTEETKGIMDLPDEIWGLIFKRFKQNEILTLRYVCQDWKEEIDKHYDGWKIRLDDRSPYIEHVLRLRIKKCKIIRFVNPSPLGPQTAFFHPEVITEIEIMEDYDEYAEIITPQNLHNIFTTCTKNLKVLTLSLTETLLNSPTLTEDLRGYTFPNLTELNIAIQKEKPDCLDESLKITDNNMFHRLIGQSVMPSVEQLSVKQRAQLSQASLTQMSYDVLTFVGKRGKGLHSLTYQNYWLNDIEVSNNVSTSEYQDIDLDLLKKANLISDLTISLNTERVEFLKNAWKVLLECQTRLRGLYVENLVITSTCLRNLAFTSFETLAYVDISELSVLDRDLVNGVNGRVFDLSIFQNCVNLEELRLVSDAWTSRQAQDPLRCPELRNLSRLPESIRELDMSEFMIRSDDFMDFVRNHLFLSNIKIYDCWSSADGQQYGINGTILEELIKETYTELLEIAIDQFNTMDPEESQKLKEIFKRFDHPVGNNERFPFMIKKLPKTGQWGGIMMLVPLNAVD